MATSYTSLLGFALPVTGELSGTWGDVVNDNITKLVEDSIAGTATASVASGDWTLTTTGSGAANQARCAILIPTGTPGVSRNIIAPSQSKAYVVINQSNAAVVIKGAATTGVTVATGTKALVAWNGSDFVIVATADIGNVGGLGTGVATALAVNIGTAGSVVVNGGALGTPSSGTVTNLTGTASININGSVGATTPSTGVFTQVDITAQGDLRLQDTSGGQYVALQAPGTVSSSFTLTLPSEDGTNGQALVTDGSGVLSFEDVSASSVVVENDQTISSNYTVTAGKNASSVGPVTINTGYSVTVGTGQRWLIFG